MASRARSWCSLRPSVTQYPVDRGDGIPVSCRDGIPKSLVERAEVAYDLHRLERGRLDRMLTKRTISRRLEVLVEATSEAGSGGQLATTEVDRVVARRLGKATM